MTAHLLDNRLAPLTDTVGLLQASCEDVAGWWTAPRPRGGPFTSRRIDGTLEQLLRRLLPLTAPGVRELFVPTEGGWTANFSNYLGGGAIDLVVRRACKDLGCRGAAVVAAEDTVREGGREGVPGGTMLSLFDGKSHVRTLAAMRADNYRWVFQAAGDPLPFEETERYTHRSIRARLTPEMLDRYLRAWAGIRLFDPDFYAPEGWAILVETGFFGAPKEWTLEEARAR